MEHPPQLFTSVDSSTHVPPQLVCVPGQTIAPQVPPPGPGSEQQASAMHTGLDGGHWTSHPPQLFGSFWMDRQVPAQQPSFGPHGIDGHPVEVTHEPPTQLAPGAQRTLHPPQLPGSFWMDRHVPLQHPSPGPHGTPGQPVGVTQDPATQLEPAPHRTLQPPQLFTSVSSAASHPFATTRSQSPKPRTHAPIPHAPPLHAGVALGVGLHTTPQPPQLFGSDAVIAHPTPQHC